MLNMITRRKSSIIAIVVAMVAAQPTWSDSLNVSVDTKVADANVSVGSSRESTRTVTANVDGSVSRNTQSSRRVVDSDSDATLARNGATAQTCFRLFGTCPNAQQQQATAQPAAAPSGQQATNSQVQANQDGSVRRTAARQPAISGDDFVGIILMSADREVLGIVQSAVMQPDGTVLVTVQISATINAPRRTTTLQFRPTSMPDQMITFGLTAQQFVNSLT